MSVSTWDLLKTIGFGEDHSVISDPPGGLSIDFGNFKMSASFVLNRWFREAVLLSGIMSTSRTIAEVECEMPREVESWEQGVAWVTWCLDNHANGGIFKPALPIAWLTEGRQNRHLLPWERERAAWERERAAYAARPHCQVQRDWARVALRNLSEIVATLDDEAPVIFQFDGEVLRIRCADSLIANAGSGQDLAQSILTQGGSVATTPQATDA